MEKAEKGEIAGKRKIKFKFNPENQGIAKVLGPLESDIMRLIWEQGQATVGAIHQSLQQQRASENKEIAYTTVMTTMSRLEQKRILRRQRTGLAFIYTPVLNQAEFTGAIVKDVLDGLFSEYGDMTVDYMIEYLKKTDEANLNKLERSLTERKNIITA